jgi:hypothetical protein
MPNIIFSVMQKTFIKRMRVIPFLHSRKKLIRRLKKRQLITIICRIRTPS